MNLIVTKITIILFLAIAMANFVAARNEVDSSGMRGRKLKPNSSKSKSLKPETSKPETSKKSKKSSKSDAVEVAPPTDATIDAPVEAPVDAPPTDATPPVDAPIDAPVEAPVDAPPTDATPPVDAPPTDAPVEAPVDAPPTDATPPVDAPVEAPSLPCIKNGAYCGYDGLFNDDDLINCNYCCNAPKVALDEGNVRDDWYCECLPGVIKCGSTKGVNWNNCDRCCNGSRKDAAGSWLENDNYYCIE